jgi:hypothetical protein
MSWSDDPPLLDDNGKPMLHLGKLADGKLCRGVILNSPDFESGGEDEAWWSYRCKRCGDTFRSTDEFDD